MSQIAQLMRVCTRNEWIDEWTIMEERGSGMHSGDGWTHLHPTLMQEAKIGVGTGYGC